VRTARFAPLALALLLLPAAALAQDHHGDEAERPPTGDEPAHGFEAQEQAPRVELPLRILASLDVSAALRIVQDPALQQTLTTPGYLDLRGGVVLPGADFWRHGFFVGVSTNLAPDGPSGRGRSRNPIGPPNMSTKAFAQGLDPASQWVLTPGYLAYFRLSEDFVVTGHFAVPIAVAPYTVLGFELGGSIAWMFTAGMGVFAEADFDLWLGIDTYPYPTIGGAVGLQIDYEVLP